MREMNYTDGGGSSGVAPSETQPGSTGTSARQRRSGVSAAWMMTLSFIFCFLHQLSLFRVANAAATANAD